MHRTDDFDDYIYVSEPSRTAISSGGEDYKKEDYEPEGIWNYEYMIEGWLKPIKQIKPFNLSLKNRNLMSTRNRESRELSITPQ